MAVTLTRDYALGAQFAKNASIIIPPVPSAGVSYRRSNTTPAEIENGQGYDNGPADSSFWNQFLFLVSGLAQQVEAYGWPVWSALTNYTGDVSFCMGQDGIPYHAVQDSGPASGGAKEPSANPLFWETLAQYIQNQSGGGGGVKGGWVVGDIALKSFRLGALPTGWYFCNGGRYALNSPQQLALDGLPTLFKTDWNITTNASGTNVPNLFSGSDGYFLRAVNGSTRQVGSSQNHALQNITGTISLNGDASGTGAFSRTGTGGGNPNGNAGNSSTMTFNASNVATTANETRPMNIGMTPAIFLGV